MELKEILKKVDHTLLSVTATENDIERLCAETMRYDTASVCVPPCYVGFASKFFKLHGMRPRVCTVVGFPNGYTSTNAKVAEVEDALAQDSDCEIDMVINQGWVKDQRWKLIENEIKMLKHYCRDNILKVIVETANLTEEELIKLCEIVTVAGADYIKTSTGFASRGATIRDVEIMKAHVGSNVKIKAAGGIASIEDAEAMIKAGADRLGTSRLVKIAKEQELE